MSEENLNKKFEKEYNKLSEKDKREINNLIRFMHEKKYHDSQYEELLNQYIELSRDYEKSQNIIKEVREYIEKEIDIEKICRQEKSLTICKKELLEILNKVGEE